MLITSVSQVVEDSIDNPNFTIGDLGDHVFNLDVAGVDLINS